jgi:hypothetical protein
MSKAPIRDGGFEGLLSQTLGWDFPAERFA